MKHYNKLDGYKCKFLKLCVVLVLEKKLFTKYVLVTFVADNVKIMLLSLNTFKLVTS